MNKFMNKIFTVVFILSMLAMWILSATGKVDPADLSDERLSNTHRSKNFVEQMSKGISKITGSDVPEKVLVRPASPVAEKASTP